MLSEDKVSHLSNVILQAVKKSKKRDKSLYDAWKAEQTKQEHELRASIVDHEKRK